MGKGTGKINVRTFLMIFKKQVVVRKAYLDDLKEQYPAPSSRTCDSSLLQIISSLLALSATPVRFVLHLCSLSQFHTQLPVLRKAGPLKFKEVVETEECTNQYVLCEQLNILGKISD